MLILYGIALLVAFYETILAITNQKRSIYL
jgi:hypothetical protein